jgi:two-component system chemotaxis response regulator CheB
MFRTAARAYGARAVGVVLSGNLDDGTSGLAFIANAGGVAVVRSPDDALYSGMPTSAIAHVDVDHVLPLADIPACIAALAGDCLPDAESAMSEDEVGSDGPEELDEVELDRRELERLATAGRPLGFTCPECHGWLSAGSSTAPRRGGRRSRAASTDAP